MFKAASREDSKIKIAITGPAGSGKTYSAILLAKGLGGKIAIADTENASAGYYKHLGKFDVAKIKAPFTTEKYIEAINYAVKNGYDTIVLDSITHAWSGQGGLLEQKNQLDARGGSGYTNWGKITPKQEAFMSAILDSDINVIATMRSKQDYVLVEKNGKQVPQKVGLAPQQRDSVEYEFSIVLDVAMNHEALASKDRTSIFGDTMFKISEETGKKIRAWLDDAEPEVLSVDPVVTSLDVPDLMTPAARSVLKQIHDLTEAMPEGDSKEDVKNVTRANLNSEEKLNKILNRLKERAK